MEGTALVSSTTRDAGEHTATHSPEEGSNPGHTLREASRGNPSISHVGYFRQRLKIAKFQRELQSSAWRHGDKSPRIHMINSLGNGQAGAVNGTVILFHAL